MKRFADRAKMTVSAAPGTGPYALGAAVAGYQTFAAAGVANGDTVSAIVEDGSNWQYGLATYAASGPTLTFTTIYGSSNGGAAISASSGALIFISILAEDLATLPMARQPVADANYAVSANVGVVAYTAITAPRTVTLPAANSFEPGALLRVVDESGECSATITITLARAGTDTINGGASAAVAGAFGFVELMSNGSNAWTIVSIDLASAIQAFATSKPSTPGVPWNDGGAISTT